MIDEAEQARRTCRDVVALDAFCVEWWVPEADDLIFERRVDDDPDDDPITLVTI